MLVTSKVSYRHRICRHNPHLRASGIAAKGSTEPPSSVRAARHPVSLACTGTQRQIRAVLGAQWVTRHSDPVLARAAEDLIAKIGAVVPERLRPYVLEPATDTPPARDLAADGLDMARVRAQIHAGRKIASCYRDEKGRETRRTVWPVTVGYLETVRHLIAWCELRQDFRSFRTDRVTAAGFLDERYPERPSVLRTKWRRSLVVRAKAS